MKAGVDTTAWDLTYVNGYEVSILDLAKAGVLASHQTTYQNANGNTYASSGVLTTTTARREREQARTGGYTFVVSPAANTPTAWQGRPAPTRSTSWTSS